MAESILETVLKRDRLIVLASLGVIVALCWLYLVEMAGHAAMGMLMAPIGRPWNGAEFWATLAMWVVMMAGMMLPSAAPFLLLFMRADRQGHGGAVSARVPAIVAGYLAVWSLFSLAATLLQWQLAERALLSSELGAASPYVGGAFLIAAGLYEWWGLKQRCLRHCQSPLLFFLHHSRPGVSGAFRMGVEHGAFCVGCCGVLMLLLFAVGIMNLIWIAALAAWALLQKLWRGQLVSRAGGVALIAAGVAMMVAS